MLKKLAVMAMLTTAAFAQDAAKPAAGANGARPQRAPSAPKHSPMLSLTDTSLTRSRCCSSMCAGLMK